MSKLHDKYLQLKEGDEKPPVDYNSPQFWEFFIEKISNMDFASTVLSYSDEWYTIIVLPYIAAINKKAPQICKFVDSKLLDKATGNIWGKIWKEADEHRCAAKYDSIMNELAYILEKDN